MAVEGRQALVDRAQRPLDGLDMQCGPLARLSPLRVEVGHRRRLDRQAQAAVIHALLCVIIVPALLVVTVAAVR